jgi:hypothetical protein
VFVIGYRGDMFTRFYDFDIAGHDPIFFNYSYEDQRGKGDGAPIQLPGAPWIKQPKIPGKISSAISIEKTGVDGVHRILRVEGIHSGNTGYWERDVADPPSVPWRFHETGMLLAGKRLANPAKDTSRVSLAPVAKRRYVMRSNGVRATIKNFSPHCSPTRLKITTDGHVTKKRLFTVDGLRQAPRAAGLDDEPREQYGAIRSADGSFQDVTVQVTSSRLVIPELGWTFARRR